MIYDELVALLPEYEQNSEIFIEAFKGIAKIFSYIEALNQYVMDNTLITTATDRLNDIADELALDVGNLDIEEKREVIRATLWALHGTIRKEDIIRVAKAFTNGDIEIISKETHGGYIFKFVSILGRPKQINKLDEALKKMLNAGYLWNYEYKYNTWQDVKRLTWGSAAEKSWTNLREEAL